MSEFDHMLLNNAPQVQLRHFEIMEKGSLKSDPLSFVRGVFRVRGSIRKRVEVWVTVRVRESSGLLFKLGCIIQICLLGLGAGWVRMIHQFD